MSGLLQLLCVQMYTCMLQGDMHTLLDNAVGQKGGRDFLGQLVRWGDAVS